MASQHPATCRKCPSEEDVKEHGAEMPAECAPGEPQPAEEEAEEEPEMVEVQRYVPFLFRF